MASRYAYAIDALESIHGITAQAQVDIVFHRGSPDAAESIVRHFPDLDWEALQGSGSEWVQAKGRGFEITIFLDVELPIVTDTLSQRVLQRAGAL